MKSLFDTMTEAERQNVAALYTGGMAAPMIALETGCSYSAIYRLLRRMGMKKRSHRIVDLDSILEMRQSGMTFASIGRSHGFTRQRAWELHRQGIKNKRRGNETDSATSA